MDYVAPVALISTSALNFDVSWRLAICLLPFFVIILRAIYQAYFTTLRDIPGPWQARFTRLWLLNAISSRSFHTINLDLHRKYGTLVSYPSVSPLSLERLPATP